VKWKQIQKFSEYRIKELALGLFCFGSMPSACIHLSAGKSMGMFNGGGWIGFDVLCTSVLLVLP